MDDTILRYLNLPVSTKKTYSEFVCKTSIN